MEFDGSPVTANLVSEPRGERRFHSLKSLQFESVRRQTFVNWTVSFVDPDKLVEAGFFYLRTMDHVQCAFCRGIVGFWDEGDEPMTEHKKHFPNCPFVMGSATGNVPKAKSNTDESRLYELLNQFNAFKVAHTRPSLSSNYHIDSTRVADGGQVAFPHFNTQIRRLQTFASWPTDTRVDPESLAESGFFYTGLSDFVQCFQCGGGLFAWRAQDDPVSDHARFYPCCNFIRMKRSEQSGVETVSGPIATYQRQPTLTKQEAELLLLHPLAKRLITLGLSPVSVKEALKQCVETCGYLCSTVTEALELVFDYDEKERRKPCSDGVAMPQHESQETNHETVASSSTTIEVEKTKEHFLPPTPPPEQNSQPTYSDYTKMSQEVQALRQEVKVEEGRITCRQCGKERVEVVFQPCSHFHLCADCARPRDSCITCGSVVRGTLRPIFG